VAVNVAVAAAADTVTDEGTDSRRLLLEMATAVPPTGAALLNVTVQLAVPDPARLFGRQAREVRVIGGEPPPPVMIPPVGERVIALPELEAPSVLLRLIVVLVTPEAIVRFTTATVPFDIMLVFMPEARQV
jgi:hypothetical protein